MNTLEARPQAPPVREDRRQALSRAVEEHKAVFERLLRDRAGAHDVEATEPYTEQLDVLPGAVAITSPTPQRPEATATPRPSAHSPVGGAALSRTAAGAASDVGTAPSPVVGSAVRLESSWTVSLPQGMGVAIEVRATGPAGLSRSDTPATWNVAIASSTALSSVLAHHAPRLNERLRARALVSDHVRIQSEDDSW